ncbi:MAG TPA: tRNA pseudouridine(13) synthase TruD [Sulfolobales archaeon]|nr:tRNA pseudouridine(13) synthase TruD [Sulfolobales archaeon]
MGVKCIETRSRLDTILGMECYLTASEPVRPEGILNHDNFYVYEYIDRIGILRPPIAFHGDRGELYAYLLIKRGVDTYRAINRVRRILKPKRISYYGLKDSRSTSYQLIVVERPENLETYVFDKDIEAVMLGISSRHARRGGNVGNCFKVPLESLINYNDIKKISEDLDEIEKTGFIPNYYSYQRFGVKRPITHVAGMGLVCGSYENALRAIVTGDPYADPRIDLVEKCGEINMKGPGWMDIERIVCRKYIETRDSGKAVKSLPKNYLELYISALLSYIFNLYLSLRWRDHGLGLEPTRGEVLLRSRLYGVKIPGVRISISTGEKPSYVVIEALSRYGLEGCRPRINKSIIRSLVLPIGFKNKTKSLEFCLDSGGYATNLLREIFKEHTPALLSPDLDLGAGYH